MELQHTKTCGVQEIVGLSYHPTAKDAMFTFCKMSLRKKPKYHGYEFDSEGTLYCFYLFTAALTKYSKPYGEEFAAYIVDHKLGEVVSPDPVLNEAFHPDHKNQAWLWAPDVKALEEWYDKQGHKADEVKKVAHGARK